MNENNIKELIDRFLDGDTTPAEETQIYAWFARHSDAGELEQYRPMFAWYSALPSAAKARPRRRFRLAAAAAVTAAVTFAGALAFPTWKHNDNSRVFASLEGSYIIENGQRITDISKIYERILESESLADSITAIDIGLAFSEIEDSVNAECAELISFSMH